MALEWNSGWPKGDGGFITNEAINELKDNIEVANTSGSDKALISTSTSSAISTVYGWFRTSSTLRIYSAPTGKGLQITSVRYSSGVYIITWTDGSGFVTEDSYSSNTSQYTWTRLYYS